MALIKEWETSGSVIYLDLVAETWPTEDKPFLATKVKNEKTWRMDIEDKIAEVSWIVTQVVKNETSYKWQPVRAFKIKIVDWDETYIISPTLTNASKNMINACLGSLGENITIKPYLNKVWYPDVSVKSWWNFASTLFEYNDKDLFDKIWDASADSFGDSKVEDKIEDMEGDINMEDIPFR